MRYGYTARGQLVDMKNLRGTHVILQSQLSLNIVCIVTFAECTELQSLSFPVEVAAEALRQAENDFDLAMLLLQTQADALMVCVSISSPSFLPLTLFSSLLSVSFRCSILSYS